MSAVPPHDLGAERAILGAVLFGGTSVFTTVAATLRATDWYTEANRSVYAAMVALAERTEPIDALTVAEELRRSDRITQAGGPAYLALLCEEASIAAHLDAYLSIVRDKAVLRELIAGAMRTIDAATEARQGVRELVSEAERSVSVLVDRWAEQTFDPAVDWAELVARSRRRRVQTRLDALDRMLGGIDLGTFVVVGGRTSHGKTSYGCELLLRFGQGGWSTEYVTLEETRHAIVRRLIGNLTGISLMRLKDMATSDEEFRDAEDAVRTLQGLPITIRGVASIRSIDEEAVLAAVAASSAQIVIVDHIHQITTHDESRVYGLDRVVKRLLAVAVRDDKLVIGLAQLGRDMDQHRRPPVLADLSDASAIEKTARQVWLLYWPSKHKPERDHGDYEVYVTKHSDGPTGVVSLRYEALCGRFRDEGDVPR